jgi:hypothetical protein
MQLPEKLYAHSLKERWNNTREWIEKKGRSQGGALAEVAGDSYLENEFFWPSACFGSANSWLLIVGFSPGVSPPAESHALSEWRKMKHHLFVAESHPGFTFQDRHGYFKGVSELVNSFFKAYDPNVLVPLAFAHHSNLLPTKSGSESDMSEPSGKFALQRIAYIFQETRPKCIIALTEGVFKALQRLWEQQGYPVIKHDELHLVTPWGVTFDRRWELRRSENNDKILFVRAHQHPVRPGFKECLKEFADKSASIAREKLDSDP